MKKYILIWTFCSACVAILAQDVENITKAKPFTINGFANASFHYVDDSRPDRLQSPFGYSTTVGLNMKLYNTINIPLSFTYANQQSTFNRPSLLMLGASPSYKWIKLHIGYRNFNISPYLLSGASIRGLGIELTPGIFTFSLFKGDISHRYNYGYNADDIAGNDIIPFKRNGYGGKIGIGGNRNFVKLAFFKAADDPLSGSFEALDTLGILPMENFGSSINAGIGIKNISLRGNLAGSILNSDVNAPDSDIEESLRNAAGSFININESSRYALAYDVELAFQLARTRIGLKYQHIDPEYETLGFVFLQQDLDNYTLNLNTALFRSKVIFSGNIGWQFTNTKEYFDRRDKRLVWNTFMTATVTKGLQISAGYNNFNSEGNLSLTEVVDSLQITTNNKGLSTSINYTFGTKNSKSTISANMSRNNFDLLRANVLISNNTSSVYSLSYGWKNKDAGYGINGQLRMNSFSDLSENNVKRLGMSIAFKKNWNKKIDLRLSPSYDFNYTNDEKDGHVYNFKIKTSYRISPKTTASIIANYRKRKTQSIIPFSQWRIAFQINSRF